MTAFFFTGDLRGSIFFFTGGQFFPRLRRASKISYGGALKNFRLRRAFKIPYRGTLKTFHLWRPFHIPYWGAVKQFRLLRAFKIPYRGVLKIFDCGSPWKCLTGQQSLLHSFVKNCVRVKFEYPIKKSTLKQPQTLYLKFLRLRQGKSLRGTTKDPNIFRLRRANLYGGPSKS